jgi:hypothetical protein
MFGQTLGMAVSRVGIGGLGNTAANIAGQVATQAIVTATSLSGNVKSKDEITLDLQAAGCDRTSGGCEAIQGKGQIERRRHHQSGR